MADRGPSAEERLARALAERGHDVEHRVLSYALADASLALYDPETHVAAAKRLWCGADKPGRERPSEVEPAERRRGSRACSIFFPPDWWIHAYRCGDCGHWFHKACLAAHIAKTGCDLTPRLGMGFEQYGDTIVPQATVESAVRVADALRRLVALTKAGTLPSAASACYDPDLNFWTEVLPKIEVALATYDSARGTDDA